jgi:hypothetical protein
MEMRMDYSLADVVRKTGGKRRSVQLWAESRAIVAYPTTEKRGTGTHRRFSRDEVIIACCLNGLARRQVAIGELIRIGSGLRTFLNRGKFRVEIEKAILNTESFEYYLVIIWAEEAEEKDPYVLLLDESEFSPEIGNRVKGHGLSIILPLTKCLSGLRV